MTEFRGCESVLELGSGTGQHAVFFAEAMPWLTWHTSDLAENLKGISSWITDSGLSNVREPMLLDVQDPGDRNVRCDGVFSANTAHIMNIDAVRCMFDLVADLLPDNGPFCLYGPFTEHGGFNSESNQRFDASLKAQDPAMGIRDLEELEEYARMKSLKRSKLFAMPANNMLVVWRKDNGEERR
jgi:cyclopropane fatty-acyl-phospholipid synthase-like methyltransferase